MLRIINTSLILLLSFSLFAQKPKHVAGQLLVKLEQNMSPEDLFARSGQRPVKQVLLSEGLNIYQLFFEEGVDETLLLDAYHQHQGVLAAQFNHLVESRNILIPNDEFYLDQWDMEMIKAPEAWPHTTGGLTALGDTIVVGIVDGGCDITHPELQENLWRNYKEIPNNNIDDDNNGFIDDYIGWNFATNTGELANSSHGTSVSGIIGAGGNNGEGVTGINWNVKLLPLSVGSSESTIISAYAYILDMRQRYNLSDGADGAFIVASNASLGVDNGKPEDFPIWCAIYDDLGEAGVLNAGATTNKNKNVDVVGDIPTTCPSPYLIAVTNTNADDEKVANAGYGLNSIDIGAPGTGSYNITRNNAYTTFGGTSAACPHVAGAIALVCSAKSQKFADSLILYPALMCNRIKEELIKHAEPNSSLQNISVSEGRLSLPKVVEAFTDMENLPFFYNEIAIPNIYPNPSSGLILIEYESPDVSKITFEVYNMMGQKVYEEAIFPAIGRVKQYQLNLSNLKSGVYSIRACTGKECAVSKFRLF